MDLKETYNRWLMEYAGTVSSSGSGWLICCPFHEDNNPSCTVFFDSGVFSCLGCGATKPPAVGFLKLGVPKSEVEDVFREIETEREVERLPELSYEAEVHTEKVGVLTSVEWPEGWRYRGIRSEMLRSTESPIVKLFSPKLTRLWLVGKGGKRRQEKYSRLSLSYGKSQIHLRLSSEQEVRVYNSSELDLSAVKLPPFGLTKFFLKPDLYGIILVEGPYDVLQTIQNLHDLGYYKHFEVIGLLGVSHWTSFLRKLEIRILPQLKEIPVLLAFDNDRAGKDLTKRARADLQKLFIPKNQIVTLKYDGKDPGTLDKVRFQKALEQSLT